MRLAPSVLAGDLADLRSELASVEQAGCDYIHFDVMDGCFVPNLTFGPPLVRCARQYTNLPFDVHLMVEQPEQYVAELAGLDVRLLSFHIEATRFAPRLISVIRQAEMGPAVALNPQTPAAALGEILPLIDCVLVMSVDPGFAGQAFIETAWQKIATLAEWRRERSLGFKIEVDGGVCADNLSKLAGLGVDIAVAGKAFFSASDRMAFAAAVHSAARNPSPSPG